MPELSSRQNVHTAMPEAGLWKGSGQTLAAAAKQISSQKFKEGGEKEKKFWI